MSIYTDRQVSTCTGQLPILLFIFYILCTRPSPGLLPVLGPLGSGTDTTHQPGPALRLLGLFLRGAEAGFEPGT